MKLELFLMSSYFIIILHECVKTLFFFNWNLLNFELKIGSIIKKMKSCLINGIIKKNRLLINSFLGKGNNM